MGGCPLDGKVLTGINQQSLLEGVNGLFEIGRAIASDSLHQCSRQVVLGHSPVDGKILTGSHQQSLLVGVNGLFQILRAIASDSVSKCNRQVVLGLRPLFPVGFRRSHLQYHLLITGDRNLQIHPAIAQGKITDANTNISNQTCNAFCRFPISLLQGAQRPSHHHRQKPLVQQPQPAAQHPKHPLLPILNLRFQHRHQKLQHLLRHRLPVLRHRHRSRLSLSTPHNPLQPTPNPLSQMPSHNQTSKPKTRINKSKPNPFSKSPP